MKIHNLKFLMGFSGIVFCLGLILYQCKSKPVSDIIRIRPPLFDDSDPILLPPSFEDVLERFEAMRTNFISKQHHLFHHKNSNDSTRFLGSYGLGTWDFFGEDVDIPGNREERNATTYPLPETAANIALAFWDAFEATANCRYRELALQIIDNFLKHEQLVPVGSQELRAEEMSVSGAFTNWQIRSDFPKNYFLAGRYAYIDNPEPLVNGFHLLRDLSVPPLQASDWGYGLDSTGYNKELGLGTVVAYSGDKFAYHGEILNGPHPDASAKAILACASAISENFPNHSEYLQVISRAAQGLYGFDFQNRWMNPSIEVGARVVGIAATIKALKKCSQRQLSTEPAWPVEELLRDMRLRLRMVADPYYPGWFYKWTPGGPIPNQDDWWMIQSGPDFFGTDIVAGKRFPWFLLIHDNYETNEDNQLWYFSKVLAGIAEVYPILGDDPADIRFKKNLKDFLCQGFNYFLHFQDTTNIAGFKGGIRPDAYSVWEFSMNQLNYQNFNNGNESVIKRYSHKSFGSEALTYPFPVGLQAVIIAAMNIPELENQLQPLINSGINHLLACSAFYKPELENQALEPMRKWLAPEVFKTLALYLKYTSQIEK